MIKKTIIIIFLLSIISVALYKCTPSESTKKVVSSDISSAVNNNSISTEKDVSDTPLSEEGYYKYTNDSGETVKLDISPIRRKNGICVDAAEYCDGYALIYKSRIPGIALYDKNANFVELREFFYIDNKFEAKNIFRYSNIVSVDCIGENENLITMYDAHSDGNKYLDFCYDINTTNMYRPMGTREAVDEKGYIYNLIEFEPYSSHGDNIYLLSQSKDEYVEYFTFTYPAIDTLFKKIKASDKNNTVIVDISQAGMEITVDFETKTMTKYTDISKRTNGEPEDSLYNTMTYDLYDTSPSGRYSIYVIDSKIAGTFDLRKLALVDNYTGKSKYLCELEGNGWSDIPAYAGFLSDDEIYHVNDDYIIYSTDIENDNIIYRLSDDFPFNEYIDAEGNAIVKRVFEFRETEDQRYVAVYCEYPYGKNRFTDNTYMIAVFDNRGNMLKKFDTGIKLDLDCGVYWSYINGDNLEIHCQKSDAAITGTFNLTTGTFIPYESND